MGADRARIAELNETRERSMESCDVHQERMRCTALPNHSLPQLQLLSHGKLN